MTPQYSHLEKNKLYEWCFHYPFKFMVLGSHMFTLHFFVFSFFFKQNFTMKSDEWLYSRAAGARHINSAKCQHRADRKTDTKATTEHLVNFHNKTLSVDANTKFWKRRQKHALLLYLRFGTLVVVVFITHTYYCVTLQLLLELLSHATPPIQQCWTVLHSKQSQWGLNGAWSRMTQNPGTGHGQGCDQSAEGMSWLIGLSQKVNVQVCIVVSKSWQLHFHICQHDTFHSIQWGLRPYNSDVV